MNFRILILTAALFLMGVSSYAAKVAGSGLFLPHMAAFTTLGAGKDALVVLESNTKVRISQMKKGVAGEWSSLPQTSGTVALTADETGLLLLVRKIEGSLYLSRYRSGKPEDDPVLIEFPGKVGEVGGIAARNGILWMALRRPADVFLFAYDGHLLGRAEGLDVVRSPFSVTIGAEGEGYVTDPMGPSVVRFSGAGVMQQVYDLKDTGITRPTGITIDDAGYLWISDGVTGRIARFETFGDQWDIHWPGKKSYDDPIRLVFDSLSGNGIIAVEGRPGRILWLEEYGK